MSASKIEDIYPAQLHDIVQLSELKYTARNLFAAEIEIMNAIGFDITFPTELFFLTQFVRISNSAKDVVLYSC
jgi:hypothetical protein